MVVGAEGRRRSGPTVIQSNRHYSLHYSLHRSACSPSMSLTGYMHLPPHYPHTCGEKGRLLANRTVHPFLATPVLGGAGGERGD